MKKILTCLLLISILTACFVVGLFALSVVKDDKEFNEVTTEVTKNIDDKTDDTQKGSSTKKDDTKSEPTAGKYGRCGVFSAACCKEYKAIQIHEDDADQCKWKDVVE